MSDKTPITQLKRQILNRSGVQPAKRTKRMLTVDEQPDIFHKTSTMKLIEYKYHIKIENEIFLGSLMDVVRRFNYDIDKSTVSKWRKYIKERRKDG